MRFYFDRSRKFKLQNILCTVLIFNVNFEHIQSYVYENNYDEDFLWN